MHIYIYIVCVCVCAHKYMYIMHIHSYCTHIQSALLHTCIEAHRRMKELSRRH